ncbi:MAG TPA: VWA domain-containing protein [Vicinamibacterales bacterium]|nr:VWA domain-containing protein [Vicinamibacterales bacterium]
MLRRLALAACAVTVAGLTAAGQSSSPQKPEQDPQRPTFRTEANFVRVDVFPTKNGAPVQDLTAGDFTVLEDGVPQKIETFEFVRIQSGGPQALRHEPNTIGESRQALKNPRARVFVLFLDVPHVTISGTWHIREPLVRLLDRVLGDDDLVGIMTPKMAASDIVFARKTEVIAGGLRDRWPWGERFTLAEDDTEYLYRACYPWRETEAVVAEMTARRRERLSLDAMYELVTWLREVREERKAIVTISEGWRLFRPNPDLTRPRNLQGGGQEPIPGPEPIGVGPDGRLRVGEPHPMRPGTKTECDRDRQYLSAIDNDRHFRDIMDAANRANASFYTVDPRGLPAFDAPIGPAPPPPPHVDQANLHHRIETLRTLAGNTDGIAVVNSNDIEKGLRRMADDLTSYYLLGYYSTNTKFDGRFRQIRVTVDRPGIEVRARRGYKAATREEMTRAARAATVEVPEAVASAREALAPLAAVRASVPLRTRAVAVEGGRTVWVAGEFATAAGAAASAEIVVTAGELSVTAAADVPQGRRGVLVPVRLPREPAGPLDIRVRITAGDGSRHADMVRAEVPDGLPHPLLFRRGPSTGNRVEPLGDPVFSRTERARFDVALAPGATLSSARLLDRNGAPLDLPVTLAERTDDDGVRWGTAEITLAPLAPGDYVIELSATGSGAAQTRLTGIRVTR